MKRMSIFNKMKAEKKEPLMNRVAYVRLFRRYQSTYRNLPHPAPFFNYFIFRYTYPDRKWDPDEMQDFLHDMNDVYEEYCGRINEPKYIDGIHRTEQSYDKIDIMLINLAYQWFEFFDLSHEIEKNYDSQAVDDIFHFLSSECIDFRKADNMQVMSWFTRFLKKSTKVQV